MSEQKKKKLRPYIVRVRTQGIWWDEYEVQAVNEDEARDDWMDDDVSYKLNDDPIAPKEYEWEVYDVKPDFYEDEYDDE
jgi:hypothetical protein